MKVQEIPEIVGALRLTGIENQEKLCRAQARHDPKARRLVIKGLELEVQLVARPCRECWTKLKRISGKGNVERQFSQRGGTGYACEVKENI